MLAINIIAIITSNSMNYTEISEILPSHQEQAE